MSGKVYHDQKWKRYFIMDKVVEQQTGIAIPQAMEWLNPQQQYVILGTLFLLLRLIHAPHCKQFS